MEIDYSDAEINRVLSFLRVGASLETALMAISDNNGEIWSEEKKESFKKKYIKEIEQAIATCRILCLHNIMTEGGVASSQYILDGLNGEHEEPTKKGEIGFQKWG